MNRNIGKILKESRISSGISVKEISDILVSKGYKASESTIYSWENENSQPTPGAFLVMCGTYGIKNVLNTFGYNGYNEDGSIQLNMREIDMVEKYRELDAHGKKMVDFTLNEEWERSKEIHKVKSAPLYSYQPVQESMVVESVDSYGISAAHERTDIEVTDEMRQYDDNIMDDENF